MEPLKSILKKYKQTKLLQKKVPENLSNELLSLDWEKVEEALCLIKTPKKLPGSCIPLNLNPESTISHPAPFLHGQKLGCLVMAGGQATRLNGALKGLIPVSPYTHKPTLQMIAEKIAIYSASYNFPCYLGIMTSEPTHEKIYDFFESNNFLGLNQDQITFFKQSSFPALDEEGQLIIKNGSLFMVPDGNGGIFKAFAPLCKIWEKIGVSLISVINSDNPLIDPFLPNLFEPLLHNIEMTAAAVERTSPNESVGLFVQQKNTTHVQEYSEIDPKLSQARDTHGNPSFRWANISFITCSLNICKKAATHTLPLHLAKKKLNGFSFWKAEYFIFDHFPLISSFKVVPVSRDFFAPIKNLTGPSSPEAVRDTLEERDKKFFLNLHKTSPPLKLELPETLYYPKNDS